MHGKNVKTKTFVQWSAVIICTSVDGSWTDISFAVQLADIKFGLWPDYEIQANPGVSAT